MSEKSYDEANTIDNFGLMYPFNFDLIAFVCLFVFWHDNVSLQMHKLISCVYIKLSAFWDTLVNIKLSFTDLTVFLRIVGNVNSYN